MDDRKMPIYEALYLLAVCYDRNGQPAVPEDFLKGMERRVSDALESEAVSTGLARDTDAHPGTGGQPL